MKKILTIMMIALCGMATSAPVRSMVGARQSIINATPSSPPLPDGVVAVEYIQSDRNQFINPLCIFTTTSSLYLDFTPTRVYNGESFIAENSTDGKAIIRLYNSYGSSGISYIFRNNGDNIGTRMRNIYDAQERLYRITFLVDAPRKYIHLTIGEEIVWTTSKATIPLTQHDTEPNFFLLKAYAKIHGFKFWDNGILKRDMIPVRVVTEHGENEGAMFDKISGIMCYNQGTGSFIIGPDL